MSKHSLVRQQESWLEQKQLLLITFWIQFWGLQKQTTLRHINRNFKAKSKLTKPTMDSEAPHDISKACFALFLSCCTGAHFLRVIRRGRAHGPENFRSLLLLFCLRAKGRNARIKHVEFGTPKEVQGSKDGTKDSVCAWERAKERERKSARELRGKGWVS